jgi:hypothetical protein
MEIAIDFNKMAEAALEEIGDVLVKSTQENMDEVSLGRVYIIGGKRHIASKPGDSANNMTGALRETIRYEISGRSMEFGEGDSVIDYAKYLEGKMNRPNVTKAILQNKARIEKTLGKLFVDSIKVKKRA